MKIVKLLEDIYNMYGRDIGDYAWLNATEVKHYKYASEGDFFVYDKDDNSYINHNCSIPEDAVNDSKHEVSNVLELLYEMDDRALDRYDISNLRGNPLKQFIELDIDTMIIGDSTEMSGDGEVGITVTINDDIYNFWWVGAEPLGHFKYFNTSDEAKQEAKLFILEARLNLVQYLIEKD